WLATLGCGPCNEFVLYDFVRLHHSCSIHGRKVVAAMNFGEKLKAERSKRGWSQEQFAEKLFVSRQSVSKWENGQNYPSIEIIIKVSDLFGVTIDELLRSDEELTKQVIKDSKQLAYP